MRSVCPRVHARAHRGLAGYRAYENLAAVDVWLEVERMAIARHHYQSGHEEFNEAVKSNPSTSFLRQFSQRLQEVDDFYLPKSVH